MIIRTDIAVVIFIINILIFFEESLFCHRAFVWENRHYVIIQQQFCNSRCFISSIYDYCIEVCFVQLIIQSLESAAVMLVSRVYCVPKNPSVLVAGSLYGISKNVFVFPFTKPPTVRVCCAAFDFFYRFICS